MNTQKLTQKSLEAIQAANGLAVENQNQQIEQVHLLSALLEQEGGLIPQLFEKMGVSVDNVQIQLKNAIDNLPAVTGSGRKADEVYVSQDVDRALREAEKEAARMKDDFVSVEHLVLGLFDAMGKELQNVLKPFSVTKDAFLAALMKVLRQPACYRSESGRNLRCAGKIRAGSGRTCPCRKTGSGHWQR